MPDPQRPTDRVPVVVLLLALALPAVGLAAATGGAVTLPWWLLAVAACLLLPAGSWSHHTSRSRLVGTLGLVLSCLVFVGAPAVTGSWSWVAVVAVPLWLTVLAVLTPHLAKRRLFTTVLYAVPVVAIATAMPAAPTLDLSAGADAVAAGAAPALLVGGSALLVGTVVDLLLRLRSAASPAAVRSVTALLGGLTLALVITAGAVAAGTYELAAAHLGPVVTALSVIAALALIGGLRGLLAADAGPAGVAAGGGALTVLAVGSVLGGTIALPAEPLVVALSLTLLLVHAGVLGAVTGLCGAAALLRSPGPRVPSLPSVPALAARAPHSLRRGLSASTSSARRAVRRGRETTGATAVDGAAATTTTATTTTERPATSLVRATADRARSVATTVRSSALARRSERERQLTH